ncbi:MAG: hypothetical protein GX549_01965 [Clostridiales bacterium]|nr:hypothetical protein [Clostridiales bacterium]
MDYRDYLRAGGDAAPQAYGVYPKSIRAAGNAKVFMAREAARDVLVATGDGAGLRGETFEGPSGSYIVAPLSHENACALRRLFPFTAPTRVLGRDRSFGVGDRLGIAAMGHIRVFERYDAYPVLAQQSIRELDLTCRTYEDVLDCVTFIVYREGYEKGYGADGDHLKKAADVEYALRLGYTMITLDCSEHIRADVDALSDDEVRERYAPDRQLEERYLGKQFNIGEGVRLTFTPEALRRAALLYGDAIDFAAGIYDTYFARGKADADFEMSIDETATPTTPLQHFFVANELIRRGVTPATIAPRFCGEFQKGIDYIGDIARFTQEIEVHCAIARHFGYKISVHSGSDKFSVFPVVGEKTRGRFHVKTAGTNWLEAMRVVAQIDPGLYREVHRFALGAFPEATRYYHVTTDIAKIPDIDALRDEELPYLFLDNNARQLIHITYGLILGARDEQGAFLFRDRLYALWRDNEQAYADALALHIGRHLDELGVRKI